MNTPVVDFLRQYQASGVSRLHMPGHKGKAVLGFEPWDITEVKGADSLYEAEGIIAQSEENAAALFGTRKTFYSAEGSSQCIRAMLALALQHRPAGTAPVVLAARNVHKTFLYAAALLELEVEWLYPAGERASLCSCPVTAAELEEALSALSAPPMAVYVTSPDYLGGVAELRGLAEVAHRHGTLLLVDNAHGAYLRFLEPSRHPTELGADACCDSAHKTLPAVTGGAYLHIGKSAPVGWEEGGKEALALFGSTSPSYLILASLDMCNKALSEEEPQRICAAARAVAVAKERLRDHGWVLWGEEPLKLTVYASASGYRGETLAERLRQGGVEPEYADPDHVVLMVSGATAAEDMERATAVLLSLTPTPTEVVLPSLTRGTCRCSVRKALFSPRETLPVAQAVGRVLATPSVSCPPAVPILVCGEEIDGDAAKCFAYYGVSQVQVIKE